MIILLLPPLFPLSALRPRLPRREGQRLLCVRDTVQPDPLWERDVLCQDTQQGVGQVSRKEIQQDGAVHLVSQMFRF